MSLLGKLFGLRYDKGLTVTSCELIRMKLEKHPLFKDAYISLKDGDYSLLEPRSLKEFVSDHAWVGNKKYKKEVFDCDDFAACARGDFLKAGYNEGFSRSVFVAEICHYRPDGQYHAANLLMDSFGDLWFYEPQTGLMTKNLSDHIKHVTDVWG